MVNWLCFLKTLLILSLHQVLPSCLRLGPLHNVKAKLVEQRLLEVASDLLQSFFLRFTSVTASVGGEVAEKQLKQQFSPILAVHNVLQCPTTSLY